MSDREEPDDPNGALVLLAVAVEREGRRLARKVHDGELTKGELEWVASTSGDGEPRFALWLLGQRKGWDL